MDILQDVKDSMRQYCAELYNNPVYGELINAKTKN